MQQELLQKKLVQKTAEAIEDLIGNKIADKITSTGKSKQTGETKKVEKNYIPPEKRQQIIDDHKLFCFLTLVMRILS